MGFCVCSLIFGALRCVLSSFAITFTGKREQVALFCLSSWCLAIVVVLCLFLTVSCVGQQCVIAVFSNFTHLLFHLIFR